MKKEKLFDFYASPSRQERFKNDVQRKVNGVPYWICVEKGLKPIVEEQLEDLTFICSATLSETTMEFPK